MHLKGPAGLGRRRCLVEDDSPGRVAWAGYSESDIPGGRCDAAAGELTVAVAGRWSEVEEVDCWLDLTREGWLRSLDPTASLSVWRGRPLPREELCQ